MLGFLYLLYWWTATAVLLSADCPGPDTDIGLVMASLVERAPYGLSAQMDGMIVATMNGA